MNLHPQSSKAVLVCAFGLLAAFFMPWIQLFGVGASGYNLGRLGSYGNYAWIIPILSGATILLTFSGINNRTIGALSGIIPIMAIGYALLRVVSEFGSGELNEIFEVAAQVFSIGIYLTIIFSISIIVVALIDPTGMEQGESDVTSSNKDEEEINKNVEEIEEDSRTPQTLYEQGIELIGKYQNDAGRKLIKRAAELGNTDAAQYLERNKP